MMPNYYLGNTHNTVESTGVDGRKKLQVKDHDPTLDPSQEVIGEAKKKRFSCF